jgi:predicted ATPase
MPPIPAAYGGRYPERVPVSEAFATALLQRVRRLSRAERGVLLGAAVIGRRFRFAVLSATTALNEERLREALDKVCALQFVVRERSSGDWYAFRHALIRDVVYEEFVATRLRPTHRRIARALEQCARVEQTALDDLAYHSWLARDAVRGRRYNEMAGDLAAAAFADADARVYYARAREFAIRNSKQYRRLTGKIAGLDKEG